MSLYKEDVYETEDPPVPEPASMADQFENKEIEKIHMDLQGAKRRFGNCILYSESTGNIFDTILGVMHDLKRFL
jgi:hypothetical protein